jgi:hypothetical protein
MAHAFIYGLIPCGTIQSVPGKKLHQKEPGLGIPYGYVTTNWSPMNGEPISIYETVGWSMLSAESEMTTKLVTRNYGTDNAQVGCTGRYRYHADTLPFTEICTMYSHVKHEV